MPVSSVYPPVVVRLTSGMSADVGGVGVHEDGECCNTSNNCYNLLFTVSHMKCLP